MKVRRLVAAAAILTIVGVALHQAGTAAPPEKGGAKSDFAVRYARAQLRVAELTLQKAQEMNNKIPDTLASSTVEQFVNDVEFAKAQLESAMRDGQLDSFEAWMRRAELELSLLENRLKKAIDANRLVRGAYGPTDLERMRAAIEVAKLRVEQGRNLANAAPDLKLAWQFEMLSEELNRVDEMVTLSIQNRLAEFF